MLAQELVRTREAELEHIRAQAERSIQDGRPKRTREVIVEARRERRRRTRLSDPREQMSRDDPAKVNREPDRLARRME